MTLSTFLVALGAAAMVAIGYALRGAIHRARERDDDAPLTTQDDFHAAMQRRIDRDRRMQ